MKLIDPEEKGTPVPSKKRYKKIFIILASIFIIIPIIIIIFISPITKYVVEKYSVKWTGRQIKMDWAYVNPFTGYAHFNNLKIYEAPPNDSSGRTTSDSVFFSAEGISVDFALRKIFSKTYEITDLTIDKPTGVLILNKRSNFNFNDIILRFDTGKTDSTQPPLHFNILNLKMNNGVFYFHSILSKVNYFVKNVYFESSGKRWNEDTVTGKFSLSAGEGTGDINCNFAVNLKTMNYRYAIQVHKFNLSIVEQYLKDITNYGTFSATLDADLKSTGSFNDEENQDTKGRVQINDFHFGKTIKEDYLSFDKFVMVIDEVNPKEHLYHLDSLAITHPYFKYEEYDKLDNIETMFGENGGNVTAVDADPAKFNLIIELAHYLINVSKNFFESAYKINNLNLTNGDIKFNDYSHNEKFSIDANPLYIAADSVSEEKGRIQATINSGIKPYGNIAVNVSINPRDSADFDVNTHITKIPISMFNPYLVSYTSFPFDRGTLEFNGAWKVRKGIIQSENHLLIIDPRVTKKIKNKADSWIPMWLVMALVRERGNVIDYSIPVTGSLKNPKFHLHDVLLSTLKNIFVKPVTTSYRLKVRNIQNEIEKSLTIKWEMRQSLMLSRQEKFMKKLASFLTENPGASIIISPQLYTIKEKEYILFFEAKKKYYLSQKANKQWLEADSIYVDKMSVKDSLFVHYLNKHLTHSLVFTIQDKCSEIISPAFVNAKFEQLNKSRENTFNAYFKENGVANRVTFRSSQNCIPYNGFSFYKIEYKGEIPGFLLKAYTEMDELDNERPREEYQKQRGKIKTI
ncbi:MAG TPA: DUF748 domain-containing protein [Bacteroidia bacterium]|nr:DUF748 domain-containing protein [Bacteroidia bacterium]